jgi:uncharacterized repeat protein (TIGR03803 family)
MKNLSLVHTAHRCAMAVCLALAFTVAIAVPSQAQTYSVFALLKPPNAGSGTFVQGFDGNFYTVGGGTNGEGGILRLTPQGTPATIYSFCAQAQCAVGSQPNSLILGRDGNFYGTTNKGGTANEAGGGDGTAFKITAKGVLTTLHSFCGSCGEGTVPNSLAQAVNGSFYGTTFLGGANNAGTIFKMTAQGVVTTLYSFCSVSNCADGKNPNAPLLVGSDGNLYGTTNAEPATLFKITPTGKFTLLHTFCANGNPCLDGITPAGALVQGSDGNLYGNNQGGGTGGGGTIYKITTTGQLTTLFNLCNKKPCPSFNGFDPEGGLTLASDGNFYGTTLFGGDRAIGGCGQGCGTIFQLTPEGAVTALYEFCQQAKCPDGKSPITTLLQGTDGNFYGSANPPNGCNNGCSLSFKFNAGLAPFVKTLPTTGKAGSTSSFLETI